MKDTESTANQLKAAELIERTFTGWNLPMAPVELRFRESALSSKAPKPRKVERHARKARKYSR